MPSVQRAQGVTLPDTKPYRVSILAVTYSAPEIGFNPLTGEDVLVPVQQVARFSEEINLTAGEARRLESLSAVKPADAPLGYEEQTVAQLKTLSEQRGITVQGSGADGQAIKDDYINALRNYDTAQGAAPSAPERV